MKKKWMPHIIAVTALMVFIVLGIGSATGPKIGGTSMLYFNANGGIGTVLGPQTIEKGASFTVPGGEGLSFGDATFDGWYSYSNGTKTNYNAGESITPPGGYITLYAKWKLDAVDLDSAKGLANKLIWLLNNAESNGNYTLELDSNVSIGTQTLFYPGKNNVTITLRGTGENRIISSAVQSKIFDVREGITLVLDNNITLQGHKDNKDSLVYIFDGKLRMNNGSAIRGNGGVGVEMARGIFEMNGGNISNNWNRDVKLSDLWNRDGQSPIGGVSVGGTFTMNDGTISNNNGPGVYIWNNSTFTMNGGSITGNTGNRITEMPSKLMYGGGGGVYVHPTDGVFIMNNGTISNNKYGGVLVEGRFTMNGGTITRNTSDYPGGGVYVGENGTIRRAGGTVSSNTPNDIQYHPDNPANK